MFLNRIHLNIRCREARHDLADPYEMHCTLCRAFSTPDRKCPEGEFLWRVEPESDIFGNPRILIQSRDIPDWKRIGVEDWLVNFDPAINLRASLKLDAIRPGQRFRFRLRANPCVTRNGKRMGLFLPEEQENWIVMKGLLHGFSLPSVSPTGVSGEGRECPMVRISHERVFQGRQHTGNMICVYSALFEGVLVVKEPGIFSKALETGIGHGKAMGLGLLSVAPVD